MALETPTWLKIEEVSSLLNIKEKTIKAIENTLFKCLVVEL